MYDNIPYELKEERRWVCWNGEKLPSGRTTKKPIDAKTGTYAKSNNAKTWSSFDTAVKAKEKNGLDGIGIMLGEGIVGIDLDNIEQKIDEYQNGYTDNNIVSEFVDVLESYAEISPSGSGIHIIVKGKLPKGSRRKGDIEMYEENRFFTVTGNHVGGYRKIAYDFEMNKLGRLHEKYLKTSELDIENISDGDMGHHMSKERVVEIAERSKNGDRFKRFMNGGWEQFYQSQSEADMAFSNDLAFWTNRDFNKMDDIYRGSALMREKWDRKTGDTTYGIDTLNKAIRDCGNSFQPDPESLLLVVDQSVKPIKNRSYSYDDTGNGERFSDSFERIVRFNHSRKEWVFYNEKYWESDEREKSRKLVDDVLRKMVNEPVVHSEDIDEKEARKLLHKHIKYSRSTPAKNNMLKEAQSDLPITPDDFDKDNYLLNVQNGYLDLNTGELFNHDKDKFFSKIANVEYTENIDHPLWDEFLNTIFDGDKELIRYIQRAIGYSLSGDVSEEMVFILHGFGRNGKSVFLNVINRMLGTYTINIKPQTLMVQPSRGGGGPSSDIARLADARFATVGESNEGMRFDEGVLKDLTGTGDMITARFLHGNDFDFYPKLKLWMATNHKPEITGKDDGIWRRLAVIPFTVQIPEEDVDKQLSTKLFNELTGILRWAVEGYEEWQRIGLAEPYSVKKQRDDYRNEMDVIEAFIDDACIRDRNAFTSTNDLFEEFDRWSRVNNEKPMTNRKFSLEMASKFRDEKGEKKSVNGYNGIEIKEKNAHIKQIPFIETDKGIKQY